MRRAVYIFSVHYSHSMATFVQAKYSPNVMPEEEQVCTNTLKTISASQYFFYTC